MGQTGSGARISYGLGLAVLTGAAALFGGVSGFGLRLVTEDSPPELASAVIPAEYVQSGSRSSTMSTLAPTTTVTGPTSTVTMASAEVEGDVRVYTLAGGSVTVEFGDEGDITVVDTAPNDGFVAESNFEAGVLTVDLRDGEHHSQLTARTVGDGPLVTLDDH